MKKQFEKFLSRRMWADNGVVYFCRICGDYLPEDQFYKRKDTPYGIDSRCKIHYTKKEEDDDGEMDYLKLNPLTEEDFVNTQIFLTKLGYDFSTDEPIYKQFNRRHGLS
jgi:hypothetical protein